MKSVINTIIATFDFDVNFMVNAKQCMSES